MKNNKTILSLAVALGVASLSSNVHAAGFQLAEYSATGLGRAYAGEAAMADNASAQWRNPAMLTYLKGTQVSVGAIYVNPNLDVEGTVSYLDYSDFQSKQVGTASDDFALDAVIPNLYVSRQLNEQLFLGFALGTNYGMETKLDDNFAASHFGNEAMIKTIEANLNLAYQLNEAWSFGGGVRFISGEGHFGATAPGHLPSTPTQVSATTVIPAAGTTLKYMEGEDTAWGWQVGTAWQIDQDHRIGFAYKSEVKLSLDGYAEGVGFGLMPGQKNDGNMKLPLPATLELASYHQLTDALAVHASFNWTDWSAFEKLEANLVGYDTPQEVKIENWEDNYRFAFGATYQAMPKLALRTGIAYDTSAVSDKNRTITIPETDRTWLSVGASYEFTKKFTLDGGFTYIIAKDASIKEARSTDYKSDVLAESIGGTFVGQTSGNVWLIGVQANYRF